MNERILKEVQRLKRQALQLVEGLEELELQLGQPTVQPEGDRKPPPPPEGGGN